MHPQRTRSWPRSRDTMTKLASTADKAMAKGTSTVDEAVATVTSTVDKDWAEGASTVDAPRYAPSSDWLNAAEAVKNLPERNPASSSRRGHSGCMVVMFGEAKPFLFSVDCDFSGDCSGCLSPCKL